MGGKTSGRYGFVAVIRDDNYRPSLRNLEQLGAYDWISKDAKAH